ncbi:MAG: GIY-YIG nuclease family protein [Gemmatimonadota bacterium]
MRTLYVYILASGSRVLYTGVTNNLARRLAEHREGSSGAFTTRHEAVRLVYFEAVPGPLTAIGRAKQIKSWTRRKRVALIEAMNPE